MTQGAPVHVAAAVIRDEHDHVLLSLRAPQQDQGGLWEFPGGKVQAGEIPVAALGRELEEELGIEIEPLATLPLIKVVHDYPRMSVVLDVWEVFAWRGDPAGREGQAIEWVAPDRLAQKHFPRGNLPILAAALLPRLCLVTPEPGSCKMFLHSLEESLRAGVRLVQLRAKSLPLRALRALAADAVELCHRFDARLMINGYADLAVAVDADGLHLTALQLHQIEKRPVSPDRWLSAACHDRHDIEKANRLGVDFGLLGPVNETNSHPGAKALGWSRAEQLVELAGFPLFALGGQDASTIPQAVACGFQGIAAISGLWGTSARLPDARLRPALDAGAP
jgi:8-oxo-dGTP diphosphatase